MNKTQPSKTLIRIKMEIQVNLPIADIPVTQTFLWNGWNTDRTLKKTSNQRKLYSGHLVIANTFF